MNHDDHDPDEMERRAFVTTFFQKCEISSQLPDKDFILNQLLEFVGWQEGIPLGDPRIKEFLEAPRQRWLYDRTTGLLVNVAMAHPVFANQLAECLLRQDLNPDHDEYMNRGFGFWHSSVAKPNTLHLPESLVFTPEERRVFGHYHVQRW